MNSDVLIKVRKLVKPEYKKIKNWAHGWEHIVHVVKFSKKLAEMENYDSVICEIAAYCHDLGRIEEEKIHTEHAALSVKPTKEILEKVGIRGEKADLIIEAVAVHSQKDYFGENKAAKILRDADKKDCLSVFGILRMIRFDGDVEFNIPKEKDWDKTIKELMPVALKNSRQEILNSFKRRLEWLEENRIETESGKKLLKPCFDYVLKIKKEFVD